MKLLSFHYRMKLGMSAPVSGHHFTLRCMPQTDERQRITGLSVKVTPDVPLSENTDQWGNALLYGNCAGAHTVFGAEVSGTARTGLSGWVSAGSREEAFLYATALTRAEGPVPEFAASVPHSRDPLVFAEETVHTVYRAMRYVPLSTDSGTTAAGALKGGCGVCQDYAHIMLAVLRYNGIPARYVAGLLEGEGASHAWVEVKADGRWYAFDPTNDTSVTDRHIKISHGRDAGDCAINRGVFKGFALQTQEVSASVTES